MRVSSRQSEKERRGLTNTPSSGSPLSGRMYHTIWKAPLGEYFGSLSLKYSSLSGASSGYVALVLNSL